MNEHFLHFVWKNCLFDTARLKTVDDEPVTIIDPGQYNQNSGPDFLNARLIISKTEWAGNIEIHFKSSGWYDHRHHTDHAYDNVILHVVVVHDREVFTASGAKLDTLTLDINPLIIKRYESYMIDNSIIACRKEIHQLDNYFIRHWLHSLSIERLERKTEGVKNLFNQSDNDWEETIYRLIAGNYGMKINSDPLIQLATRVPLKLIRKHSDNIQQVEAMLFGQAGMLSNDFFSNKTGDQYFDLLKREYDVLKSKYNLKPLSPWVWKFHRMRPVNFPTIRISQLAALMAKQDRLFSAVMEAGTLKELISLLTSGSSDYWKVHYQFGKKATKKSGKTGKTLVYNVIINSVIPLMFLYGKYKNVKELCDRTIDLSDTLPPEINRITREWAAAGIGSVSSFETQGLIELTENYCKNRECLNCHIGSKLISLGKKMDPENNLTLGEPD